MLLIFIIYLSSPDVFALPPRTGLLPSSEACAKYLDREISFEEFFPAVPEEPGPASTFTTATREIISVLRELQSGIPGGLYDPEHSKLPSDVGPDHGLAHDLYQALEDQHPSVRAVMMNISGVRDVCPGWPTDTLVVKECVLHVLPAEWQREYLERLVKHPPPFVTPELLRWLIEASARTKLHLTPRDTIVRQDAFDPFRQFTEINPQTVVWYTLDALMKGYSPDGRSILADELREIFSRHLTFWIDRPAGSTSN